MTEAVASAAVGASLLPLMVMVKTPAPVVPWLSMTVQEKTSCRLSPAPSSLTVSSVLFRTYV